MINTTLEAVLTEHEDDTLDHYVVKGMKWGRRKKRETSGSSSPKANKLTKEQEYRKNRSRTTVRRTAAASAAFSALSSMVMTGSVGTHTLASAVSGAGMGAIAGKISTKIEDMQNDQGIYSYGDLRRRGYI